MVGDMTDLPISDLLADIGFTGESANTARAALEEAGLTQPGRVNISLAKRPRIEEVLSRFARACTHPRCQTAAKQSGRELVPVRRHACEFCGGSDNQRSIGEMLETMRQTGYSSLLIVGGTPNIEQEFLSLVDKRCEVKFVLGHEHRNEKLAGHDAQRFDVVVVWGSTPIPHKLSLLYKKFSPVVVQRRGIAALADAVTQKIGRTNLRSCLG